MQLSTSSLNVFADCRRCFYIDKKFKIARPRGIFPSLPGGVDLILKKRLDGFRGQMPPEFEGIDRLTGWRLFADSEKLNAYRQWNSKGALKFKNGTKDSAGKENVLVGGLDEILQFGNPASKHVAPAEYKTKGSEPKQEDCEKYYGRQLDIYGLLLSTEYHVDSFGALFYFWPVECPDTLVRFQSKIFFMDVEPARAMVLFEEALALLEGNVVPEAAPDCAYCGHHAKLTEGRF